MGENQIMEKKLSLQKLIAEIILVAYSLVLLMLVFLEMYMFANYRNTIREKWQNALYESAQKVEGTIDSVNADIEAIKETMDVLVDTSIGLKSWSFQEIKGKPYAISVYRSGRAALCEICNLEQVKQQLGKKLKQDGAEVYIAYNGTLLETDEAAQAYAGMDLEKDAYYNRHYIFTDEIGNTGLNMVLCIPVGIWTRGSYPHPDLRRCRGRSIPSM